MSQNALISQNYVIKLILKKLSVHVGVFCELTFTFAILCCRLSACPPVRLSVCLSSVVCLSVMSVHPTQAVVILGNISAAFWYVGHSLMSAKNFTEIVPRKLLRRG